MVDIFGTLDDEAGDERLMARHEPMSWASSDCSCGGHLCDAFWGEVEALKDDIQWLHPVERKVAQKALDMAVVATVDCQQVNPCGAGEIIIFKAFAREYVRCIMKGDISL